MDLTPFVESLRRDLTAAAAAGTDETRRTADLLAAALDPATRLAILDALSTAAADVTAALDGVMVEVRMNGREPRISVDTLQPDTEPEPADTAPPAEESDGGTARITLRLPESTKARAEEAANRAGISVNSWLVRAVTRALDGPPPDQGGRPGRRLVGYARG
jgi:HicB family